MRAAASLLLAVFMLSVAAVAADNEAAIIVVSALGGAAGLLGLLTACVCIFQRDKVKCVDPDGRSDYTIGNKRQ